MPGSAGPGGGFYIGVVQLDRHKTKPLPGRAQLGVAMGRLPEDKLVSKACRFKSCL